MDIEFDFKGDPVGGVITKCKLSVYVYFVYSGNIQCFLLHVILSIFLFNGFLCTWSSNYISLIVIADLLEKVIEDIWSFYKFYAFKLYTAVLRYQYMYWNMKLINIIAVRLYIHL